MATIRLLSVGSRGDLQPYLAILLELQRRGHAIQLIGSINFEAIATAHAVPFVPLPGDYRQLLASKQGLEAMLKTAAAAMAGTAPGQRRQPGLAPRQGTGTAALGRCPQPQGRACATS
jgi:sterol 3beta-glucosyltransferase